MRALTREFYRTLAAFFQRADRIAGELFDVRDAYGCGDLPEYLPCMGPRYGIRGQPEPLSVFRGEAMALFTLAWVFQPALIADYFTGTGYAAACLAGGCQEAEVCTVDTFEKYGGAASAAASTAETFLRAIALPNLRYHFADSVTMDYLLDRRSVQIALFDGVDASPPSDDRVVVSHDWAGTFQGRHCVAVLGGSEMRVHCIATEKRAAIYAALSAVVPAR